jgi:hypothetical protein
MEPHADRFGLRRGVEDNEVVRNTVYAPDLVISVMIVNGE